MLHDGRAPRERCARTKGAYVERVESWHVERILEIIAGPAAGDHGIVVLVWIFGILVVVFGNMLKFHGIFVIFP